MPNINQDLQKVTIRLYKGQRSALRQHFGSNYNSAIREIIEATLEDLDNGELQASSIKRVAVTKQLARKIASHFEQAKKELQKYAAQLQVEI